MWQLSGKTLDVNEFHCSSDKLYLFPAQFQRTSPGSQPFGFSSSPEQDRGQPQPSASGWQQRPSRGAPASDHWSASSTHSKAHFNLPPSISFCFRVQREMRNMHVCAGGLTESFHNFFLWLRKLTLKWSGTTIKCQYFGYHWKEHLFNYMVTSSETKGHSSTKMLLAHFSFCKQNTEARASPQEMWWEGKLQLRGKLEPHTGLSGDSANSLAIIS